MDDDLCPANALTLQRNLSKEEYQDLKSNPKYIVINYIYKINENSFWNKKFFKKEVLWANWVEKRNQWADLWEKKRINTMAQIAIR